MTAAAALARAVAGGVRVTADGDRLLVDADAEPPPDLLAEFRVHRDELVELLSAPPSLSKDGVVCTILDGAGYPAERCLICDGASFWCPADAPPHFGAWRCQSCEPRPEQLQAHACAVPA